MLLKNAIAALTGLWGLSVHAAPIQPVDLRNLLSQKSNSWANGTVISFPNSPTFNNATRRWSTFDAPTHFAAVSQVNEADIVKSVRDPTFKNKIETVLTSCHRSNLHHPMRSAFSPPVRAMDTPLTWEIFNKAWRLTLASSKRTALTVLSGL